MRIADGIEMIELSLELMGRESEIYPTLLWDDGNVVLIDAGGPNSLFDLKKAVEKTGVSFGKLNKIIITHQDIDHIGGVKDILKKLPQVEVLAHADDKPYIQGEKEMVRIKGLMNRMKDLPQEAQENILELFKNAPVKVNQTLTDGEELNYCGGLIIIHTPGHTPGHICIYHKPSKTLITGDAMTITEGELTGPNKLLLNEDELRIALDSLRKLENYEVENIITYHGGLFSNKPQQKIKQLNKQEL